MNRRQALSLLAALPLAAQLKAQTRSSPQHRVALGRTQGFLIGPDGTLQVWSQNPGGGEETDAGSALGLGHTGRIDQFHLFPVPGLGTVVEAAAGASASFAVLADGRVLAWGSNGRGILGTTPLDEFETRAQPRASTSTPAAVAVPFDAVDVSCKDDHAIALARDGRVYTWGSGASGQLGIGPLPIVSFRTRTPSAMPEVPYPVLVPDLADVIAISAGNRHSLALLKDGTVRAWGENKLGQVGDGTTANRASPVAVPGVRGVVSIAAGAYFSVAVLADGTVMEWGATYTNPTPRPVPRVVAGARAIRSAVAGGAHVAALTQTGTVLTWGNDAHYETGRRGNGAVPGVVDGLADVRSLAADNSTTTAVLGSGRIMTWGEVRPWTRPGVDGAGLSPSPILLWLDGLEQP